METVVINAPADKVWAMIGDFQDMSWDPAFVKTSGTGGNAVNATRTLYLGNGTTIEEQLDKYSAENRSYSYEITKVDVKVVPVSGYSSTLSVSGNGSGSTVEWKGAFYRGYPNNDPPPDLNDEAAVKAIAGLYRDGLAALKHKIEIGG